MERPHRPSAKNEPGAMPDSLPDDSIFVQTLVFEPDAGRIAGRFKMDFQTVDDPQRADRRGGWAVPRGASSKLETCTPL